MYYSSNNVIPGNIISQIKDMLQRENIRYWFDEDGISHGDAFVEVITEAIIDSESFLFISSENANSSKWTSKEIALANHFEKKIIPFRIDNSFYNKSVAFYLADIDYIEYYVNPNKAMEGLFSSLIEPIKTREKELILKKEEARKKAERLRLEKEQRNNLQKRIDATGAITKSYLIKLEENTTAFLDKIQEKDKEIQGLHTELVSLKTSANKDEADKLEKALKARTEHCNSLILELNEMKLLVDRQNSEIQNLKNKLKIQSPVRKEGISKAHISAPSSVLFILTFIAMSIVSAISLCFAYDGDLIEMADFN